MDIKVLEKGKNKLKFELTGKSHTLANLLSKELWNDKNVTVAGYTIPHPETTSAILVVETKSGDPKKAVSSAISRIKKKNKSFLTQAKKLK